MAPTLQVRHVVQPPVASFGNIETDDDVQQFAAHKIAAQFALPVSIAKIIVSLAGLGSEAA